MIYSVIDLPITPMRERISLALYGGQQAHDELADAEMGHNLEALRIGMVVIALGNLATDELNRCEHYALGTVLGEPWAQPGKELPRELQGGPWGTTDDFLTGQGYRLRRRPKVGSLAVYLAGPRGGYGHFGIVTKTSPHRRIESKFGAGPIMAHDEGQVPIAYGHSLVFYKPPRRAYQAYEAHRKVGL